MRFHLIFKGVLKKSDGWVGLGCCELAIAVECRQACKQVRLSNCFSVFNVRWHHVEFVYLLLFRNFRLNAFFYIKIKLSRKRFLKL